MEKFIVTYTTKTIPCLLWNGNFPFSVYKGSPLNLILSQINLIYTLTPYILQIHVNITLLCITFDEIQKSMRDFRLLPRCGWGLHSSWLSCVVDCKSVTDVWGQHIDAVQEECLTLNGGINTLSRNVGNKVTTYAVKYPRRAKISIWRVIYVCVLRCVQCNDFVTIDMYLLFVTVYFRWTNMHNIEVWKQQITLISSTNFNAQFSLFINNMFVTLLSTTCFEH